MRGKPVNDASWQGAGHMPDFPKPPTDAEVQRAADQFRVWLRWLKNEYPETIPTQQALSDLIGVTRPMVSLHLKPGSRYIPNLQTLMGLSRAVGYSIDHIITKDPPQRRK